MPNGGHREGKRHQIADRGAGRRRVAGVQEVAEDAGLRQRAGDRRLVMVGVPAALGPVEGEQRLVRRIVVEYVAERGRDEVTGAAVDNLRDRPAAVRAAVTGI